jgi:hypothetical protein
VGAPTEQVGQAENAQRFGHVQNGQQVLEQGGTSLFFRAADVFLQHIISTIQYPTEQTCIKI